MANTLLPPDERNLTPEEVEVLDRRRRRGQLYLVIACQCLIVAVLVSLWSGQDLTYSPGWARPMAYWDAAMGFMDARGRIWGSHTRPRPARRHTRGRRDRPRGDLTARLSIVGGRSARLVR